MRFRHVGIRSRLAFRIRFPYRSQMTARCQAPGRPWRLNPDVFWEEGISDISSLLYMEEGKVSRLLIVRTRPIEHVNVLNRPLDR